MTAKYPFLLVEKNRHKKLRYYVRIQDGKRYRVDEKLQGREFKRAYKAALQQAMKGEAPTPSAPKSKPATRESLRWLWEKYLTSDDWHELGPATQRQRINIMKHVLAKAGDDRYDAIDLTASVRVRTASQGRNFLDCVRGMYRSALKEGLIEIDPSEEAKNPARTETDGFPAWTEEDVEQYQAYYPLGTNERVWLDVLLYTGPRRGDVCKLGRQHERKVLHPETKLPTKVIVFKTEKRRNKKKAPVEVTIPILPVLQRTLDAGPCGQLTYIVGKNGRPFTKESFGNAFSKAARKAGIKKSAHGVRKIAATTAANNGATTHELMALFGWTTVEMAERYTRSASRAKLGLRAATKLEREEVGDINPAPSKIAVLGAGKAAKS